MRALIAGLLATALYAWANSTDSIRQYAQQHYGAAAAGRVDDWLSLLDELQTQPESRQLEAVNRFFNQRLRFAEDRDIWGSADYWATPLESLAKAAGDCEDYTIAKYVSLRRLGIDNDKLRLIYVRASLGGPNSGLSQAHMVLGYYPTPSSDPLILDNLISDIRPASRRPDLAPVFSFNSDGLWVGHAQARSGDPRVRLSRWRDVLQKMRQEGTY